MSDDDIRRFEEELGDIQALQASDSEVLKEIQRKVEQEVAEQAAADAAAVQEAKEIAQASREEHQQAHAATIAAIDIDNQAAKDALKALQRGKPLQDGDLPEMTSPNDLPKVDLSYI